MARPQRSEGPRNNGGVRFLYPYTESINHESRTLDASVVGVVFMKKLAVTAIALIAVLAVSGCAGIGKGKGKGPPPIAPLRL